ncbi:MAG TPA: hypothetical protein VKE74_06205 [Gemmataceae bacterium]|nr:hypothetical protein [Gemmataceae bacterium]
MAEMNKGNIKSGIDTAADKAKNLTDRAADAADTARDRGQGMMDKAGEVAGKVQDKAREWAGDAYETARDAGHKVQRWAGEAYDVAADNLGDFGRELTSLVRRHPIPALLIGFGVGLLLGRAARIV